MNVHRLIVSVIDHDSLGAAGVASALENSRYANDCINPRVRTVETRDIGEWDDAHPLNNSRTAPEAFRKLFDEGGMAWFQIIEQSEASARNKALEEAARICLGVNNYDNPMTANDCADAIRALKHKPSGSDSNEASTE